jgi:hypothetical protein
MGLVDFVDFLLVQWAERLAPSPAPKRPRRTRIREIRDGLVRVAGKARSRGELLRAPLSGRPCVAFHALVYELRGMRRTGGWEVLIDVQDVAPFAVTDDSGEAVVDVSGPLDLALDVDRRGPSGWRDPARPAEVAALTQLLESRGHSINNWLGLSKPFLFEEGIIAPDQDVAIAGLGVHEVTLAGQRSGPRGVPEQIVLRGSADDPLVISNSRAARRGAGA